MAQNLEVATTAYKDGAVIFAEFERGSKFYVIQSGGVELFKTFGDVSKTLDILKPPEMFGEMALLEEVPRSATAVAMGETKLMEFDSNSFQNLVLTNPQIAFRLLKIFVKRIYSAKRRFMIMSLEDLNARVADVFLMLNENKTDDTVASVSNRKEFKVTIENVARWSGITVAQARDVISRFIRSNYIEATERSIVVKDINHFVRIVNTARSKKK